MSIAKINRFWLSPRETQRDKKQIGKNRSQLKVKNILIQRFELLLMVFNVTIQESEINRVKQRRE
jgi:hypothetical protein